MIGTLSIVEAIDHRVLRLRGFKRHWIQTSVGRMHAYIFHGPARRPPLVVLHGINTRPTTYRPTLERILDRVGTLIVPDLPGHGHSETPRSGLDGHTLETGVIELLDALIDTPAVLFGNSLGGLAAIRYALARPDRLRALLLCSPAGAPMDEASFSAFTDNFSVPSRRHARAFLDLIHATPPWYGGLIAGGVRRRFLRPAMKNFVASLRPDLLLNPKDLEALQMPLRLLWGTDDHLMPREGLAFFRAHLPEHAEILEPEGLGHSPYLDRPELLAEHMLSYLQACS